MPEQKKNAVEKRVFCAGFFTFCAGVSLLFQNYLGNFPALFLPFVIFTGGFALSSFGGKISEKKSVRLLYLLIFSGLLLYFRETFLFPLISGIAAGVFSADSFAGISDKTNWNYALRDYFSGGVSGTVIASFGILSVYVIPVALFLYAMSLFLRKKESVCQGVIYTILFLIMLSGIFYVTDFTGVRAAGDKKNDVPQEHVSNTPLKQLNMLAYAHFPLNRTLLIQPAGSAVSELGKFPETEWTVLHYGKMISLQDRLSHDSKHYDLIAVELNSRDFSLYSLEFIRSLKNKLTPHGVLFYYLPGNDILRAGALRSALQQNFVYLKAGDGIPLFAASDFPLQLNDEISVVDILNPILYSRRWEEATAAVSARMRAPTMKDYFFERTLLKQNSSDPVYEFYHRYFPLDSLSFSIVLFSLFILYLIVRYIIAYVPGMGLRFTVLRDSVLFFLVTGLLFFSRTLGVFSEGYLFSAALLFLLLGGITGCFIPLKNIYLGFPCLIIMLILSRLLMPYIGILFSAGVFARCFLCGCILPVFIRNTAEKYKTGTVEPEDIFSSVCSGLFIAVLLLAVMP